MDDWKNEYLNTDRYMNKQKDSFVDAQVRRKTTGTREANDKSSVKETNIDTTNKTSTTTETYTRVRGEI